MLQNLVRRVRGAGAGHPATNKYGLVRRTALALGLAALATASLVSPVAADGGEEGGLLGGLLGGGGDGGTDLLPGVTDTVEGLLGGTSGDGNLVGDVVETVDEVVDGVLGGDALGSDLLGGDLLGGDLLGGDLLGGDLLGGDLLGGDLLDETLGPDGLGVLTESHVCVLDCEDGDVLRVETGVSGEVLPGVVPQTDVDVCVSGPCARDGDALVGADVTTDGNDLVPETTLEACVAGDCEVADGRGDGLGVAHLQTGNTDLLPGTNLDACVVAVCDGPDAHADAVLAATLLLDPEETMAGGGLLGTGQADVCLLGTCEVDGRFRSGVLTIDLTSDDESLLPGLDGVVCVLAVCDRPDTPADDPTDEDEDGSDEEPLVLTLIDPGSGGTAEPNPPSLQLPPPAAPAPPAAETGGDGTGDPAFPATGVAPEAASSTVPVLPIALGLVAIALAWTAGLYALRRGR